MAFMLNGFGTAFSNPFIDGEDGSKYIAKWIVILWIPIIPLRCYKVYSKSDSEIKSTVLGSSEKSSYAVRKVPMNWKYLLLVGGSIWLGIIISALSFYLASLSNISWLSLVLVLHGIIVAIAVVIMIIGFCHGHAES
jgi:hypothetical protein